MDLFRSGDDSLKSIVTDYAQRQALPDDIRAKQVAWPLIQNDIQKV